MPVVFFGFFKVQMYELESHKIETWRGDSLQSKYASRNEWHHLCPEVYEIHLSRFSPLLFRCLFAVFQ